MTAFVICVGSSLLSKTTDVTVRLLDNILKANNSFDYWL